MTEFYAGQIAYQDLVEPKTLQVGGGEVIARGQFCSMDSNGYLEVAGTSSGKSTVFSSGMFVALQSVDNSGGSGGDATCQVACVRSRVVLPGGAGIVLGMPLQTKFFDNKIVIKAADSPPAHTVTGTAYEFPGEPDKLITAKEGELVVVDLGIGV